MSGRPDKFGIFEINVILTDTISECFSKFIEYWHSKPGIRLGSSKNNISGEQHRPLLMIVYSSGLRVSEVVVLKAVCLISEYCSSHDTQTWFFSGQNPAHHLTVRTAQKVFDKAILRAKITKNISIRNLCHAFATHLL